LMKSDVVDWFYKFVAWVNRLLWTVLSRTETGRIRWYAAGIAAGAVILVAIAVFA
jgi:NADH-quinone oxidoreductase subunit L